MRVFAEHSTPEGQIIVSQYASCPHCGANVKDLYGRFVDPADPVEDCRECGKKVKRATGRMSLHFKK